jgi:phosphoribosylcarboxyaminoimidazole (NCAIR) mutase
MGSISDMPVQDAIDILKSFDIEEVDIVSAHRTPKLFDFSNNAHTRHHCNYC